MAPDSSRQGVIRVVRHHVDRVVQVLALLVLLALERLPQVHVLLLVGRMDTLLDDGIIRTFCHHALNVQISGIHRQLSKKLKACRLITIILLLVARWETQ